MLLLFEKNKLSLRSPARKRNHNLLFRNSQQYYSFAIIIICPKFCPLLFGSPFTRSKRSFCAVCQFFFSRRSPTQDALFFLFRSSPPRDRSITAREERTRSARYEERKKGRLFARARERARLREREKEREREREDESKLDLSAFCVKNERGVHLQTSLWRFKEYISF